MPVLHVIYASTSGHTAYMVDVLADLLKDRMKELVITRQRAEQANPEDLLKGDILMLASGTWNTGGIEGQLNPHMHAFLRDRAKETSLRDLPCVCVGLGDDRYHYTARALQHLDEFVRSHHGKVLLPGLRIVNEPYGQEEKIRLWVDELVQVLKSLHVSSHPL